MTSAHKRRPKLLITLKHLSCRPNSQLRCLRWPSLETPTTRRFWLIRTDHPYLVLITASSRIKSNQKLKKRLKRSKNSDSSSGYINKKTEKPKPRAKTATGLEIRPKLCRSKKLTSSNSHVANTGVRKSSPNDNGLNTVTRKWSRPPESGCRNSSPITKKSRNSWESCSVKLNMLLRPFKIQNSRSYSTHSLLNKWMRRPSCYSLRKMTMETLSTN